MVGIIHEPLHTEGLRLSVTDPGCIIERHTFQVLISLEGRDESRAIAVTSSQILNALQ